MKEFIPHQRSKIEIFINKAVGKGINKTAEKLIQSDSKVKRCIGKWLKVDTKIGNIPDSGRWQI